MNRDERSATTPFRFVLDPRSIKQSSSGSVTGQLHVEFDGAAFPDESWDDFVVVILGWWCEATKELTSGEANAVQLEFMDGPFHVSMEHDPRDPDFVLVRSNQDSLEARVLMAEVQASLLEAAERALAYCDSETISDPDVDFLTRSRAELWRLGVN